MTDAAYTGHRCPRWWTAAHPCPKTSALIGVASSPYDIACGIVVSLWEEGLDARSTRDGISLWQRSEPFGSPYMNNLATNSSTVFVAINSLPWND